MATISDITQNENSNPAREQAAESMGELPAFPDIHNPVISCHFDRTLGFLRYWKGIYKANAAITRPMIPAALEPSWY